MLTRAGRTRLAGVNFACLSGYLCFWNRQKANDVLVVTKPAHYLEASSFAQSARQRSGVAAPREVRADGLSLLEVSMKLNVSWRPRDLHPWDRDLPEDRAADRLLDQTLHDTEDAVERIFSAFPEASSLELNVSATRLSCPGWWSGRMWAVVRRLRSLCAFACLASTTV
jgi:hypothetical protein